MKKLTRTVMLALLILIVGAIVQPAPPAAATPPAGSPTPAIHVVKKGETLSGIAKRYGVTVQAISAANRLRSSKIYVGQRLRIPAKPVTVTPAPRNLIAPTATNTPLPSILPTARPNN